MLSLIPLACFLMAWLHASKHRGQLGLERLSVRGAFVVSFVLFQVFLVLVTEILSVGAHLSLASVTAVWVVTFVVLVVCAVPYWKHALASRDAGRTINQWRAHIAQPFEVWIAVAVVVAVVLALAVEGALYPPSNGDSLVYHLVRVAYWIQAHSVDHFATHYLAQIEFAPLAELNILHVQLLSGSDRLDGYVQLLSLVVCVAGATELARLLGGSRRSQAITAVVCVTIPSLILEGASTQNNAFAAAIGVAWIITVLGWGSARRGWVPAFIFGLTAGLAWLAKGTLIPMVGPAVLLLLAARVLPEQLRGVTAKVVVRRIVALGGVLVIGAVVVAGPFVWRNVDVFGSPTGPVSASTMNADFSLRASAANTIRSLGLNFRIGNGSDGVDTFASKLVLPNLAHVFNQFDVAPDDTRYVVGTDSDAFTVRDYSLFARVEDFGANPWHALLLAGACVVLAIAVLRSKTRQEKRPLVLALVLALGLACGFVLFAATARWTVFATRYQIPLLVAWSPIIGLALARLNRTIGIVVVLGLSLACFPQLFENGTRSLLRPTNDFTSLLDPYFPQFDTGSTQDDHTRIRSQHQKSYEHAIRVLARSSCDRLGVSNWIVDEYPLWAGLKKEGWTGEIEHVDVKNVSRRLERPRFHPCAFVQMRDAHAPPGVKANWFELTSEDLTLWIAHDDLRRRTR